MTAQVIPLRPPATPTVAPGWYATLAAVAAGLPVEASEIAASAYAALAAWDGLQRALDDTERRTAEILARMAADPDDPPCGW
jgi:hypothetical protein